MNLGELALLAEVISAIAIIASLLYVGKQLKQTNSISRSTIRQELSSQMNTWAMSIASSPELAATLSKVHFHELVREDANDTERIQIAYAYVGIISQLHYAYEQMKEGFLIPSELEDYLSPSSTFFSRPYLRSAWHVLSATYPADFRKWFEQRYGLTPETSK